jgi:hypothetical protein
MLSKFKLELSESYAWFLAGWYSFSKSEDCIVKFHSINENGYWKYKIVYWDYSDEIIVYKNYE